MHIVLRLMPLLLLAAPIAACDDPEGVPTSTATVSPSPTTTATTDATPTLELTATAEPASRTPAPTAEPAIQTPTSTSIAQPSPSATSAAPVTLRLGVGESGDAGAGWMLRFDAIENDSRCGVDVVCVWAGEATVVLTATSPSGEASEVRIVLSPGEGTGFVDGLALRGYGLLPQPRSNERIDPSAYVVSIEVTRG